MQSLLRRYVRCLIEAEQHSIDEASGAGAAGGPMLPLGASSKDVEGMNKRQRERTVCSGHKECVVGSRNARVKEERRDNGTRHGNDQEEVCSAKGTAR